MSAALLIGGAAVLAWIVLLVGRDGWWLARERDDPQPLPYPVHRELVEGYVPPARSTLRQAQSERDAEDASGCWPSVTAIVPARDEAKVVARAIGSLLAQDYPAGFRVILLDDGSRDGTGELARAEADRRGSDRLEIVRGRELPTGWTGKLWAVAQGIERTDGTQWLWLTDADIVHAPDTLRMLVARAEADGLVMHSLMAKLRCESWAERALIPAFVLFFQMLYPFAAVNDPRRRTAGAAGGCVLLSAPALARAGGIARIAHAIIDDCALGRAMKAQGPIRLSLTARSESIRPYVGWREIGAMVSRSAYAQLNYSPFLLAGTLAALALIWLAPPLLALFAGGPARWLGLAAWMTMALSFQPMLRFYRRSPVWGLNAPAIGLFYAACTFASAVQVWRGRGGQWKGRAQAKVGRA